MAWNDKFMTMEEKWKLKQSIHLEKKKTKKIVAKAWQTKQKKNIFYLSTIRILLFPNTVKSLMLSFELRNEEEADEYTAWIFTSYNINIIQKIISWFKQRK